MNWKRWKMGLIVAALTGMATGLSAFAIIDEVTWKMVLKVFILTLGITAKDMLLFLKDHPAEQVEDGQAQPSTPQYSLTK